MSAIESEDAIELLRSGTPYGAAAFAAGLALTYAMVTQLPGASGSLDLAGVFYGLFHVVAESSSGESLFASGESYLYLFLAFPGVPLTAAGMMHARTEDGDGLSTDRAALRGAAVGGAYAVLLVVGALLFQVDVVGDTGLVETTAIALDPLTTGIGGLLVGAGFGALGGVLEHRAPRLLTYLLLGLGLALVLLFVAAAGGV